MENKPSKDDPLPVCHSKTILVVNTGSKKKEFIFKKYKELGLKIAVINKEKIGLSLMLIIGSLQMIAITIRLFLI